MFSSAGSTLTQMCGRYSGPMNLHRLDSQQPATLMFWLSRLRLRRAVAPGSESLPILLSLTTYRLAKKYSRYVHIGREGRKNCCVMGIRSSTLSTTRTAVLISGADGRMASENNM